MIYTMDRYRIRRIYMRLLFAIVVVTVFILFTTFIVFNKRGSVIEEEKLLNYPEFYAMEHSAINVTVSMRRVEEMRIRAAPRSVSGVVFIRIPKCASRTMETVFQDLSEHNNYSVICSKAGGYKITLDQERRNARLMNQTGGRFVLTAHHYLYNVSRLTAYRPVYLTVVREPVSWFLSNYNWHKYHLKYGGQWWNTKPIGECINDTRCYNYVRSAWGPTHFLCGTNITCRDDSPETLEVVRRRIDQDFLLVGYKENLSNFTKTLQYFLPHFFTGLPQTFSRIQAGEWNLTMTSRHDDISQASLELLTHKLARETHVYNYVRRRFDEIYTSLVDRGLITNR